MQSSEVDQKQVAMVTKMDTLQGEIDLEKAEVKKLVEHFIGKKPVDLAQLFLGKSLDLMSVLQGPNDGKKFSSIDYTSTILGNLISLARPDKNI